MCFDDGIPERTGNSYEEFFVYYKFGKLKENGKHIPKQTLSYL
jgi:hypothetical protein